MISCFQLKHYVKCFQTSLKCFKLKKLVIKSKTTQSIKPDEEPVKSSSTGRGVKKNFYLSSRTVVQSIKVEPQPVNSHLNRSRSNDHMSNIKC